MFSLDQTYDIEYFTFEFQVPIFDGNEDTVTFHIWKIYY